VLGDTDFVTVSDGLAVAVTVNVDGAEVWLVPVGSFAEAVAVFEIDPVSMSAWVTVYDAVQVTLAVGASDVAPAGQLIADNAPVPLKLVSLTVALLSVTLPVLVTTKEYANVCPAAVTVAGDAVLATVSAGLAVAISDTVDGAEVVVTPAGFLPEAVAVLDTDPVSMSACVTM
jgi:hypothetical protein